jgi:hypothetical protein
MNLKLDEKEAKLVAEILHNFSGRRNCPPGCITASEIAQRINVRLKELEEAKKVDDPIRHVLQCTVEFNADSAITFSPDDEIIEDVKFLFDSVTNSLGMNYDVQVDATTISVDIRKKQ